VVAGCEEVCVDRGHVGHGAAQVGGAFLGDLVRLIVGG
jgi:hypothetical protein